MYPIDMTVNIMYPGWMTAYMLYPGSFAVEPELTALFDESILSSSSSCITISN